jgi:hypothetical protein
MPVKHTPCPHCGARDSAGPCPFMSEKDLELRGYPKARIGQAREADCRVAYYHDLFERTGSYDAPEEET